MEMTVAEVRDLMIKALDHRGISGEPAEFVVDDYMDAELEGKRTHGVGKFLVLDNALSGRAGEPVVEMRRGSTALINGNREIGQLAARTASALAVDLAVAGGIGIVRLKNFARFSRLIPYAKIIADRGFVGIVSNNAGPPAVAPFGSGEPILGTNPIAFGFPTPGEPFVVDFSTAERVWGEIRQAELEGRALPSGAFLDAAGHETAEPSRAEAVMAFGGAKGSALCIALEALVGALTGARTGLQVHDEYDLGAVFIAIEPMGGDAPEMVDRLLSEVRNSSPRPGGGSVVVPGERSRATRRSNEEAGTIELDDTTHGVLREMAAGRSGMKADDKLN
ncbi:Ldh family oxidoreductase [Phytohabitans sp. LJ34]|uniref:Ldh family oxidoreductase n=1 Tax=Phytohabitans sp. LJ34 TaxID=3452217 RepID=UPI003F8A83C0